MTNDRLSETFGALAVAAWGGLFLRDERLRALIPERKE
jgi:hypothetical protein